jgi:hypothetical protein
MGYPKCIKIISDGAPKALMFNRHVFHMSLHWKGHLSWCFNKASRSSCTSARSKKPFTKQNLPVWPPDTKRSGLAGVNALSSTCGNAQDKLAMLVNITPITVGIIIFIISNIICIQYIYIHVCNYNIYIHTVWINFYSYYGFCTKKHSTGRHHLVENGASNLELWGRLHLLPRFNGLVLLGNLNWKP